MGGGLWCPLTATNPGACKQRTDCENDASGCLTRPSSIVKGGVGMNLILSMMVIVGASVETYCWQSVIGVQATDTRRGNCKKSRIDNFLFGRIFC